MDEIIINETDTGRDFKSKENRDKKIRKIAEYLINGKVLILPSATVYGISCLYDDAMALKRVCDIKRRKYDMPFIVLISDTMQLDMLVKDINATAKELIERFWKIKKPLPLTIIFKGKNNACGNAADSRQTIAVRMAGLKVVREIIDQTGPIISTSATISGIKINPKTIDAIPLAIRENVDMLVRLKDTLMGTESTIIDITSGTPILVREGTISFESIIKILKL